MTFASRLYTKLPVLLQNSACSLYGWRESRIRKGTEFRQFYSELCESDREREGHIRAYQDHAVSEIVSYAYDHVPYYRRVMKEHGVVPRDISGRSDLFKLPIVKKADVISNLREFRSAEYSGAIKYASTSGTTGSSLTLALSHQAVAMQWAVWWRHRARFGVLPDTWHVNFTGRPVVPAERVRAPYWRWNLPMRQVLIPMQVLRPQAIREIVSFLEKQQFPVIVGYPSFIHAFCELVQDAGIKLRWAPDVIFLGAEKMYEFQRRGIEQVFGSVISDQYGFTEACGNASKCEHGVYHEDWEFGVLECVGGVATDRGVSGRIVATGFWNRAMPLIRYEVGDVAEVASETARCPCGRQSRMFLEIEGRDEDVVITPEGARIKRFGYLFKETARIKEAQVVQRTLHRVVLNVVPRTPLTTSDIDDLKQTFAEYISPSMQVDVEICELIPRGPGGKFRAVVSELGIRDMAQHQDK